MEDNEIRIIEKMTLVLEGLTNEVASLRKRTTALELAVTVLAKEKGS